MLLFVSGCLDFSRTLGISIKESYHGHCTQDPDGYGKPFRQLGHTIRDVLQNRNRTLRIVSTVDLSKRFDFEVKGADFDEASRLQDRAFRETFGLSVVIGTHEIPVTILARAHGVPLRLVQPPTTGGDPEYSFTPFIPPFQPFWVARPDEPTRHHFRSYRMSDLAYWLEPRLAAVVVDETGLEGRLDFQLTEDSKEGITIEGSLLELGLMLKEGRRSVRAIYIDALPDVQPAFRLKSLCGRCQVFSAWEQPKPPEAQD